MLVFFVKQKTAYEMRISDWSSDVCSSDLGVAVAGVLLRKDFGAWDGDDAYGATLVGEQCGGLDRKLHFRAGGDDHRFRCRLRPPQHRSEEHTSELQSLMRISYAVFCLKQKKHHLHSIQYSSSLLTRT